MRHLNAFLEAFGIIAAWVLMVAPYSIARQFARKSERGWKSVLIISSSCLVISWFISEAVGNFYSQYQLTAFFIMIIFCAAGIGRGFTQSQYNEFDDAEKNAL